MFQVVVNPGLPFEDNFDYFMVEDIMGDIQALAPGETLTVTRRIFNVQPRLRVIKGGKP